MRQHPQVWLRQLIPMPYLDHCATTPIDPEVRRELERVADEVGEGHLANPSSVHTPGRKARALLNESRARIARAIGASPDEIVFTASGSEANNLALKGAALRADNPFHLVISAFEHDSLRHTASWLASSFTRVKLTLVPPDEAGIVRPESIERACSGGASLVSVMAVNNEIGTRQPIEAIAEAARRAGALFHTDAVQALGRIELDVRKIGCDFLTASAHKIYGPAGVGFLYVKNGTKLAPLIHGGHQEGGRRAGTENLPAIAGFARAVVLAGERMAESEAKLAELETVFLNALRSQGVSFEMNGSPAEKISGIINLSLPKTQSHDLVV
ncbi:cysteine desulfurase, partial [Candidatus Sumerlaeota bacterium]|nr:cysteine desulfurase [Candidatus Sumerlaeota bacterium]